MVYVHNTGKRSQKHYYWQCLNSINSPSFNVVSKRQASLPQPYIIILVIVVIGIGNPTQKSK